MPRPAADGAHPEVMRLTTTVAWLYFSRRLRQAAIAQRLGISQSRVSRLLDHAADTGVVRTMVILPPTAGLRLEAELVAGYGLREAHVYDLGVEIPDAELVPELGHLLALHLQAGPLDEPTIGYNSWSRTLQETVRHLRPLRQARTRFVVQTLGDLGPPALQHESAQLTRRLADLTGAVPMFLRIPGVAADAEVGRVRLDLDPHAQAALRMLDDMQLALLGVGPPQVLPPFEAGDNFFSGVQLARVRRQGAVGEVNLRFIDADGGPVPSPLDELVVGATPAQLRAAPRRVAVAGGRNKYLAIRAALRGGWVNSLVTDAWTARYLIDHP